MQLSFNSEITSAIITVDYKVVMVLHLRYLGSNWESRIEMLKPFHLPYSVQKLF